jgi:hypothetical protein
MNRKITLRHLFLFSIPAVILSGLVPIVIGGPVMWGGGIIFGAIAVGVLALVTGQKYN